MFSKFLAAILVFALSAPAMATSLSFLHGSNFRDDQGYEKERVTMTLEHFGVWEYGTMFFYYDITDPFSAPPNLDSNGNKRNHSHQKGANQFFGGTSMTLSWNKMFGMNFGGIVRDVSFRFELENGSANGTYAFRNYFYGLQYDLNVPGFDFLSVNTVLRDNPLDPGVGIQLGAFWQMSHEWSRWRRVKFTGFVATSPWDGDGNKDDPYVDKQGRFLSSQPQLLWDLGNGFWGKPNRLEVGAEYAYFLNRFQAPDKDEKVLQAITKFSW